MESIKFQDAQKVARKDAPLVSTQVSKYTNSNSFSYYVCINTWLGIVKHYSSKAGDILADQIVAEGLIPLIKCLDGDALKLLHDSPEEMSDLAKLLVSDIDMSSALQVLRFPKRFSPLAADKLTELTVQKFLAKNNEVKMKARKGYPQWLLDDCRKIVYDITDGYSSSNLAYDGYFSSGAVINTRNCTSAKVADWWYPYFMDPLYPLTSKDPVWCPEFPLYSSDHRANTPSTIDRKTAKGVSVPKSYKTGRFIAEEDSTRQWFLQAIRKRLQDCIIANGYGDQIVLDDQSHNQRLSFESSIDMHYATIDLEAASDSISWSLIPSLFPEKITNDLREWRSSKIAIGSKVYCAHMAATSGSAVCFPVETIVFKAISQAATDYVACMIGEDLLPSHAYGDDLIVDTRAYDTCCDFLSMLGFTVNMDKSFTSPSMYRESCGVEYYDGWECTSRYYPRQPLSKDISSLSSLISLHNSLMEYWDVHVFLKRVIREIAGDLFTSSRRDDFVDGYPTDIWDPLGQTLPIIEPYGYPDAPDTSHIREGHMVVMQRKKGKYTPMNDMYYYVMYLMHGPMYEDPLSELLGVSTSRVQIDDCYSQYETYIDLR